MLSRWYLLFIGLVLIVMGIAGYLAPEFLTAAGLDIWTPSFWLISAVLALAVGLLVRSATVLRWVAGLLGVLYFIWGVAELFTLREDQQLDLVLVFGMIQVILGALGIAAALAPGYWLREPDSPPLGQA